MASTLNPMNPFNMSPTPLAQYISLAPSSSSGPLAPTSSASVQQAISDIKSGNAKITIVQPVQPIKISSAPSTPAAKISFSAPVLPVISQKVSFSSSPSPLPATSSAPKVVPLTSTPQGRGPGEYYNPITKVGMSSLVDPGQGFIKQSGPSSTTGFTSAAATLLHPTNYFNISQSPISGFIKQPVVTPVVSTAGKITLTGPTTSGLVSPEFSASMQNLIAENTLAPKPIQNLDQKTSIIPGPSINQIKSSTQFLLGREGAKDTQVYKDIVTAYAKGLSLAGPKPTGDPKLDYQGDPFTNPYLTDKDRAAIDVGNKPDWYKAQESRWQSGPGPSIQMADISKIGLNQASLQVDVVGKAKDDFDRTNTIPKLDAYNKIAADLKISTDALDTKYGPYVVYEKGKKTLPEGLYTEYQKDIKSLGVEDKLNTLTSLRPDLDKSLAKSTDYGKMLDTAEAAAKGKYATALTFSNAAQAAIDAQNKEINQYRDLLSKAAPTTIAYVQKYGIESPEQLAARLQVETDKVKAAAYNITYKDYLNVTGPNATPDMPGYKELVTDAPTTENEIKRFQSAPIQTNPIKEKDIIPFGIGDYLFPAPAAGTTTTKSEWSNLDKLAAFAVPGYGIFKGIQNPQADILSANQAAFLEQNISKPLSPITTQVVNFIPSLYEGAGRYVAGMERGSITIDQQVMQAENAEKWKNDLIALRDAPNKNLFGGVSTPESRTANYLISTGQTVNPAAYKMFNDIRSLVLSGKENQIEGKYQMINVPKSAARELEYKSTMKAAGDITALGFGLISGVGFEALPQQLTTLYAASSLINTPDPAQSFKAARDALALGAIMQGVSSVAQRAAVKVAGPREELETSGFRKLATAVPDNYQLKPGEEFVNLTKEPLTGGSLEGLASAKGASVGNVEIGTKIPIGGPGILSTPTTSLVPKSIFWKDVENIGGTIAKYGFPAIYGTYIGGQELNLANIAQTQGVQAYETERQKFLSEMGAFNLAMPLGQKAAEKTLADFTTKTKGLTIAQEAPSKPGEVPIVKVETQENIFGPKTMTIFQKSPGEFLTKQQANFFVDKVLFNKNVAESKPGDIPFEKALSAFAKDPVAQEYTIELAKKYGLNLYGNLAGKSYGGDLEASQRSISDLDFAAKANPLKLRTEGMTQQAFLNEWSQGMTDLGYNVKLTTDAIPKGNADVFVNTTSGEITYQGEHAMSVHPYSETIKGLVERTASWEDTLRGLFKTNPEGIQVLGAKEQFIRKLDLRPKDVFDILTYYGPEYAKIAGVSAEYGQLYNPLEPIPAVTAEAGRASLLATAKPGQAVFYGVESFTRPELPKVPSPPAQILPIIKQFEDIGKELTAPVGSTLPDGRIQTGFPKQIWSLEDVTFNPTAASTIGGEKLSPTELKAKQLELLQYGLGITPTSTKSSSVIELGKEIAQPFINKITGIKEIPAVKSATTEIQKLSADKFAKLEGQLSLADEGYGKGSTNQIIKSIKPLEYVTNTADAAKLKELIGGSSASYDVIQNKLMQVYDVEGRLLQLEQPSFQGKLESTFAPASQKTTITKQGVPITKIVAPYSTTYMSTLLASGMAPTKASSLSVLPADWTSQYPYAIQPLQPFPTTPIESITKEKISEEKIKEEPTYPERYRSTDTTASYLNSLADNYVGAPKTVVSPTDYSSKVLPVNYPPIYPETPYVPEVPPYPPVYPPTTPPYPPVYPPTYPDYPQYKGPDYLGYPNYPGYTPYAPPYSPLYNPFGGKYTPPQAGGPGILRQRGGETRKKKGLIQVKSSLFRKFAFGEKDLLINPQDVQAFRNIIAQKGTFFGYDVVPTREQISREEQRLLKSQKEREGLKDTSFLDIKV